MALKKKSLTKKTDDKKSADIDEKGSVEAALSSIRTKFGDESIMRLGEDKR